ncbi:MAG: transcriptional regulator TrmB [Candidatus Nomurabacteria bacterium]|nr:transcriptional regulator TrmB [Candidatus Nomurabacteria bacterium]
MKRNVVLPKKITPTKEVTLFLKELGLTDNQIVVYSTLLSSGILSILQISTITGINRQQLYTECDRLINKGLIQPTGRSSSKFIAAHPNTLRDLVEQERKRIDSASQDMSKVIESLLSLPRVSSRLMKIKYYYGLDQIRDMYDKEQKELEGGEFICFLGAQFNPDFKHLSQEYWLKWSKTFEKKGKSGKGICGKEGQLGYKVSNVIERTNKNLTFEPNIDAFGNNVIIVSYKEQMAMWIESEALANMITILFNIIWETSE